MGLLSGKPPSRIGVVEGKLTPVREHFWNAVSSFSTSETHHIEPLRIEGDPEKAFERLKSLIARNHHARIIRQDNRYCYAEFVTPVLKFVDDVEFLLDDKAGVIHVRSASRLGRKDYGVNRKRIEAIRSQLKG